MSDQQILTLASLIEKTSKVLWDITLTRVYADAVQNLIWTVIFIVGLLGCSIGCLRAFQTAKKQQSNSSKEAWETFGIILGIMSCVFLIAVGGFSTAAAGRFISPEWFAVMRLLSL